MILETKYTFGDVLYLKTDKEQLQRILTSIQFTKGSTLYQLSCGNSSSWHYEFEICVEKQVVFATEN